MSSNCVHTKDTKFAQRFWCHLRALCVSFLFLVSFSALGFPQVAAEKQRIICDHAAPPRGMHWVCKSQCDCHLEGKLKNDEDGTAPAASKQAPGPETCSRSVKDFVVPEYPASARLNRIAGTYHIHVKSDVITGTVQEAQIVDGHPFLALRLASLEAVRKWRFDPACGQTHDVEMTYRISEDDKGDAVGTYIRDDKVEIVGLKPPPTQDPVGVRKVKRKKEKLSTAPKN